MLIYFQNAITSFVSKKHWIKMSADEADSQNVIVQKKTDLAAQIEAAQINPEAKKQFRCECGLVLGKNNQLERLHDLEESLHKYEEFVLGMRTSFLYKRDGFIVSGKLNEIKEYIQSQEIDIAVFEVGLGGRLDATRPVNAIATVITGISIDHSAHLGKTRKAILEEKMGIARKGVPLIVNLDTDSLIAEAVAYCKQKEVTLISVSKNSSSRIKKITDERMIFSLKTDRFDYGDVETRMIGKAQRINAATAIKTIEVVGETMGKSYAGYSKEGLKKAFFPARFQVLRGVPRIIMDTSHNEQALLYSLKTLVTISPPQKNVLFFGCMARKELRRFPLKALKSARKIVLVSPKQRGAESTEALMSYFNDAAEELKEMASVIPANGMGDAFEKAKRGLKRDDTLLIFGSHHMVNEVVSYF
jgi:dihydrofolate synthase/folylpolyglutamate synthase